MAARRRAGVEWWEFLGASTLHEPCDVVYDSEASLRSLLDGLVRAGHPILLSRLAADSSTARAVEHLSRRRAIPVLRNTASSRYVSVDRTWDAFQKGLSSRRRYDLRRARNRAEAIGPVHTEIVRPSPEQFPASFDLFAAVEASGWKGDRGSAVRGRPEMWEFFLRVGLEAAEEGRCVLSLLRVGGEIAAAQLAVEWDRRLWALKIGYDERFARCSPGIQLTHATLRYVFDQGLRAYEFLGSDEPWLAMWRPTSREYVTAAVYPARPGGLWALGGDAATFLVSRLSRRLRRGGEMMS